MNEKQINYQLAQRKADLAFWTVHRKNRIVNNDGGMLDCCNMQIASLREKIGHLKRMRFALQQATSSPIT